LVRSKDFLLINFMIYFYISTAIFIGGMFIVYWLHNQYRLDIVVEPALPPHDAPLISVYVPARNEERNIRDCVESILAQDYTNIEVIVLDDRSTDATPEILRQFMARDDSLQVIHGTDLPAGWAGKPHALFQASAAAHGEWLCFVDADTFLSPAALSSCYVKAIETKADLFTIMTFQILGSFWEKVVMPIVMTALSVGFSPRKVNDPKRRDAIANGQFILIQRSVYDSIGGHERVKDQIVEDKAIAEQVKWNGYRLVVANGFSVARTRMYTSLSEMWEGWTKNIYLGLSDRPSLVLLGVLGAFLALVAALILPLWPMLGIFWYLQGGGWLALSVVAESLILWTMVLYARTQVATSMGISPWYAFTLPLGSAVFAAMMIASTWKALSGQGVLWKGRRYAPK
jgi:chlorobactene glucosyltransferase